MTDDHPPLRRLSALATVFAADRAARLLGRLAGADGAPLLDEIARSASASRHDRLAALASAIDDVRRGDPTWDAVLGELVRTERASTLAALRGLSPHGPSVDAHGSARRALRRLLVGRLPA